MENEDRFEETLNGMQEYYAKFILAVPDNYAQEFCDPKYIAARIKSIGENVNQSEVKYEVGQICICKEDGVHYGNHHGKKFMIIEPKYITLIIQWPSHACTPPYMGGPF